MTTVARPALVDRRVADLMRADVVTLLDSATLGDAAELLAGFDVDGIGVVDPDGRLVGVLTESDLVRVRGTGFGAWIGWHGLRVADFMSAPALCIEADASVAEAAALLTEQHVHRLFVVDRDGYAVGVIGSHDIVVEIAEAD